MKPNEQEIAEFLETITEDELIEYLAEFHSAKKKKPIMEEILESEEYYARR